MNKLFVNLKISKPSKVKELYFYNEMYQLDLNKRQREYIIHQMFDGLEIMTKKEIKQCVAEHAESVWYL